MSQRLIANNYFKIGKIAIFFLIFCFWFFIYRFHVLNQELYTLFLFTPQYFLQYALKPGGWADYGGLFLIQLFRYPFIGAFLQTLATVLVYYLVSNFMHRYSLFTRWFALAWIPVFMLIGLQTHYEFLYGETLKVLSYFFLFYVYTHLGKSRFWIFLAGSPLVLLLCGGGIFTFFYLLLAVYEIGMAPRRIPVYGIISWLLLPVIVPQIGRHIYLVNQAQSYSIFFYLKDCNIPGVPYALFLWLPGMILAERLFRKSRFAFHKLKMSICLFLNLAAIVLLIGIIKEKCYYPQVETLFHIDNAVAHENWDEVLEAARRPFIPRPSTVSLINLALSQKGELADRLFEFPQIGINGLIPPIENNYFTFLYGHETFYRLGQMNEALRWIYEANVCKSDLVPPHVTKRIIEILLRLGKNEAAKKYLTTLKYTWHYEQWAKETLRTLSGILPQNTSEAPYTRDFMLGTGAIPDLYHMAQNAKTNEKVRDYLLISVLFEKQIEDFYKLFCEYYPASQPRYIPKVYEEALVIVYQLKIDPDVFKKYKITELCRNNFNAYGLYMSKHPVIDQKIPEELRTKFGNTYWFYYHFVNVNQ